MLDKLTRYGVVERLLRDQRAGTILEVGAGPHGLRVCLPYSFVGVDPWYPDPPVPGNQAVKADATALPFADKSFDYVLCIEVLEHVPPEFRTAVVAELCRVAKRRVIISHPFGNWARAADRIHYWQYSLLQLLGKERPWWLNEHVKYPLPDPAVYMPESARQFNIVIRGQENWFAHNPIVFFGNLKAVARRVRKSFDKDPQKYFRRLRLVEFPPYYRIVIVMDRVTENA